MQESITLISRDSIREQYIAQYRMLRKALRETRSDLVALGVDISTLLDEDDAHMLQKKSIAQNSGKSLKFLIRIAASHFRNNITRDKVEAWIRENHPDVPINVASLSATMSAIVKEDNWHTVEKGTGGKQSTYSIAELAL